MQNHNDMEMPTGIEIFLLHHASVVKFAASTVPPAAKYQNNRRGLAVIALKPTTAAATTAGKSGWNPLRQSTTINASTVGNASVPRAKRNREASSRRTNDR